MSLCVGILCSESRSEGVDITECHCKSLALELSGTGDECLLSEEVFIEIYLSVLGKRQIVHIQGSDLKHLV